MADIEVLGPWLRSWRKAAGLSQEQLAGRAGMSTRALRDIEAGRTEYPHPASMQRLADALALQGPPRAEFLGLAQREGVTTPQAPGRAADRAGLVPRQLPPSVRQFAGREDELAVLDGLAGEATSRRARGAVLSAIDGSAGIGKTALAVEFGHRAAAVFPDGQLYVNLAGFGPSPSPLPPGQAVRGFLDALGIRAEQAPAGLEDQTGLYRSLISGRRMLVVLDNAAGEDQVRPLLPGSPGCLAVVTSRRKLAGLAAAEGAVLISLDYLPDAEARQLLAARLGAGRLAAEPAASGQIVSLCAGMPLALAIAAGRAAARPRFPLAALAAELAAAASRLDALDAGDGAASVRAAFSWSYQQLDPAAARLFRLLGLHPGPDISAPAAGSLAGLGEADARRLLGELAGVNLITEHAPVRYTVHDLLRAYASELAHAHDNPAEREAAAGRMLDHYLHTAAPAAMLLMPGKDRVALPSPHPGATPEQHTELAQAMAWFEAEHQVLLAMVILAARSGFDRHAWQLPWAMAAFLQPRGHWQDWAATLRTALCAAASLGDTAAQAMVGRLLGLACFFLGDLDQARAQYAISLELCQRLGNRLGEAKIQHNLGVLSDKEGRYADALGHAEHALRLYQALGDRNAQASALNNVGWYHVNLGDYQQARAYCRQALTLSAETGDRRLQAHVWDSVGYAEHHLGNLAEAAACYQRAAAIARETSDRGLEGLALDHLGDTRQAAGDLPGARQAWQQALAIFGDVQHPDAGDLRGKLAAAAGTTCEALGDRHRGAGSLAAVMAQVRLAAP